MLRWGALSTAIVVGMAVLASAPAEARRRGPPAPRYAPAFASIVVDANSGTVLQQTAADASRHPASLTKIMTLYLLFEQLEAGKIKLNSQMRVSAHAASQAPSKLDLKPGETIDVDSAIRAVVTKSANDVAVVIAEALAGDEEEFGKQMTRKARALGMKSTVYHNASGLPDEEQVTTARDQVLLGRAIQDRFPKYYRYFATNNFVFRGKAMKNHNKLLGRVEGIDGIKTGYTHMSGFNLVSSAKRGGKFIVAAVFGGRTGAARDAQMAGLIETYMKVASTKRTAPSLGEPDDAAPAEPSVPVAQNEPPARRRLGVMSSAQAAPAPVSVPAPAPAPAPALAAVTKPMPLPAANSPAAGSVEPIKPNLVKTVSVRSSPVQTAMLPAPANAQVKPTNLPAPKVDSPKLAEPAATAKAETRIDALQPPPGARPGVLPVQVASADASPAIPATPTPVKTTPVAQTTNGWMIQVGALESEREAKDRILEARERGASVIGRAEAMIESMKKGSKTLYRARFAMKNEDQAQAACKTLKKSKIACMAIKN